MRTEGPEVADKHPAITNPSKSDGEAQGGIPGAQSWPRRSRYRSHVESVSSGKLPEPAQVRIKTGSEKNGENSIPVPQIIENRYSNEYMYTHFPSTTACNCQKVETTQTSIHG